MVAPKPIRGTFSEVSRGRLLSVSVLADISFVV